MKLGQELSDWVSLKGSVPQGSWLGPLLFIVLIDDLHPPCIMHKYMDVTTFTVKVPKGSSGSMQTHVNQAVSWSTTNRMIPNVDKIKDMVISFHKQPIYISRICIEGVEIEQVKSVKLLGIIITDKITWNENTTYICSKASTILNSCVGLGLTVWTCSLSMSL